MIPLRTLSALLFTLLLVNTLPVSAQEVADDRYQIEVIIFEQTDPFGAEGFAIDPDLAYPEPFRLLGQGQTLLQASPAGGSYPDYLASLMVPQKFLSRENYLAPESFVELDKSRRQLNPDAYTLGRSSNYRILAHTAWEQALDSRSRSPWIILHGGRQVAGHYELEGSIRVFQSRFTHVETFLWLSQFAPPVELTETPPSEHTVPDSPVILPPVPQPPPRPEQIYIDSLLAMNNKSEQQPEEFTVESVAPAVNIKAVDLLRSSEQIRKKTAHYIDHPRMGVLVLVTPIESDEVDESDMEDDVDVNFE